MRTLVSNWTERRRVSLSNSGDATASGGYANTGVHIGDVNLITGVPVRTRYRLQVERIAPPLLVARDTELAELADFCTAADTAGAYRWWRADAWWGKSALMSWFVLHPPPAVRIVSFFITARLASQNDRSALIDNVMEQLLTLMGQTLPPFLTESTREAHLLGLLRDASQACHERNESLVLLVDGLDEDRSVDAGPDAHSIAGLLPKAPPAGMRVIVAGRPNPPIPDDVDPHHPLRDPSCIRPLTWSPEAKARREEMRNDLKRLLHGSQTEQDLLGLVAAAGGGLSVEDVAELTASLPWQVREQLQTVTGRSFAMRGSHYQPGAGRDVYLLGHEELQVSALEMLGPARIQAYQEQLHAWAQIYRAREWPAETPEYLLRGYTNMLAAAGDLPRLVTCATDPGRQERLLLLSGGDSAALDEIVHALDLCAAEPVPDLATMTRLAQHRDRLRERNSNVPPDLPAMWVLLEKPDRAEAIARSITSPERQASALVSVAEAVARAGDHPRAEALLHDAETIARSITSPERQASALMSVAKVGYHPRAEALLHDAETIARSITSPDQQTWVLVSVAKAVAQAGDHQRAEAIARSITSPERQASALMSVSVAVAKAGDHQRAEAIARSITSPDRQASALVSVAEAVARAGDHPRAEALLHDAETIARSITDPEQQASALMSVSVAVAQAGDHPRAEAIARSITDPNRQARALQSLIDQVDADQRPRLMACRLTLTQWHELASDLVALVPDVVYEGIRVTTHSALNTDGLPSGKPPAIDISEHHGDSVSATCS